MKDRIRAGINGEVAGVGWSRDAGAVSQATGQGWRGGMQRLCRMAVGAALAVAVAGCHNTPAQAAQDPGDPASANMAAPDAGYAAQAAQYATYPQQQGQDYSQQPAPIERRYPGADPGSQSYGEGPYAGAYDDQQAQDAYLGDLTDAEADVPPPPLPDYYDQPPAPDPDYLWTPGYWYWSDAGYYWVPGSWVAAPYVGALWTPGYWIYAGDRYRFHRGYWGLHIGFYGGVDYGYGYIGHGYYGGYWRGGHFQYNTAVNRVNVTVIHNVYVRNVVVNNVVVNNRIVNRVSYNGGRGGVAARPMPAEIAVLHEQRQAPMSSQIAVQHQAAQNRAQFYNQNHGRPAVFANARPVVADRTMPAALPRVDVRQQQPDSQVRGERQYQDRPGQYQGQPGWQQRQQQQNAVPTPVTPQADVRQQPPGQNRTQQTGQPNSQIRGLRQYQDRPAGVVPASQPQAQFQPRPQVQAAPPQSAPPQSKPAPAADPTPQHPHRDPHADDKSH